MDNFRENVMVKLVLSQLFVIAVLFSSCNTIANKREPIIAGFPDAALARVFAEGIISTGDYETHAAFTPGGDTVYFLKCMPDLSTCAICSSYKNDGQWGKPEIVSFSGKYLDVDPFVTSDGNTFYFVSNRPYKAGDTLNASWDIWKCDKKENDWGEPVHLDSIVNSTADEYYPTVS